jgi:tellurium resistance protein TerD
MAAPMKRGANVSLTREVPGLATAIIGTAWDAGAETVLADNLVFAAILCGADGRVLSDEHVVFFNQLSSPDESVARRDELLGGDRDQIEVDLADVPPQVHRIVFVLYVNDGPAPRRALGQLRSCTVRVVDGRSGQELVRSEDLAAVLGTETGLTLAEVYRYGPEWKFKVLGEAYPKGIVGIAADYGLPL